MLWIAGAEIVRESGWQNNIVSLADDTFFRTAGNEVDLLYGQTGKGMCVSVFESECTFVEA